MADIRLFGSHFEGFRFIDDNVAERPLHVDGKVKGNVDVKGFPKDTEVLTSRGWVAFPVLGEWLRAEYDLWERFVGGFNYHKALGLGVDSFPVNDFVYDPVLVASVSPYDFSEEGKVSLGGKVVFVQPSGFACWWYNKPVARIKMRGIDLRFTQYADVVARKRWKGGYGFVSMNDVVANRYGGYFYLMLNRFSRDIGGGFNPNIIGGVLDGFKPLQILETQLSVVGRGAEVVPADYVTRYNGFVGEMFNVFVEPFHNVIVRKEKDRLVDGSFTKRAHSGKPTVVGDASLKSFDSFRFKENK